MARIAALAAIVIFAEPTSVNAGLPLGVMQRVTSGETPAQQNSFGFYAAMSGTTCLVSAPLEDVGGNVDQGAVYVFNQEPTGKWNLSSRLLDPNGAANAYMGQRIRIVGSKAYITQDASTDSMHAAGSVLEYSNSGGTWTFQRRLLANGTPDTTIIGGNLDATSTYLFVGGLLLNQNPNGTAVFVFKWNPFTSQWVQTQMLTPPTPSNRCFGLGGVRITSSYALVGDCDPIADHHGVVYEYTLQGGQWQLSSTITGNPSNANDGFGEDIDLLNDRAFISAPTRSEGGYVFTFRRQSGIWTQEPFLIGGDSDVGPYGAFGISLSAHSTTNGGVGMASVLIAAPGAGIWQAAYEGAAYLFTDDGTDTWTQVRKIYFKPLQPPMFAGVVTLGNDTAFIGNYQSFDDFGYFATTP